MSTAARIELLQRMPIFGGIADAAVEFIVERTRALTVSAGAYFFRENDPALSMFVLESGRVSVLRTWQQRELVLQELRDGDCFGEMAMMDLMPRSASVRAEAPCQALELVPATLLDLFEHDVEQFALIQMNMGREVCRRLRQTDDALFRALMRDGVPPASHPLGST